VKRHEFGIVTDPITVTPDMKVRDAIALAVRQAATEPLTLLGDLVHNETVLAELRSRGVKIAQHVAAVETRAVMITAPCASDRAVGRARERGLDVMEARQAADAGGREREAEEAFGRADLVWVGGGSVANLLALWKLHGVDVAARDAWERGVVMAGVSAGSICWHVGGPTDSFGPKLETVTNALSLIPYGNGVHYDSEAQRRPLLQSLVADQTLPLSYATDDHAAIIYQGEDPIEVVIDTPDSKARAYRVEKIGSEVKETELAVGIIS
ncbi:MAG: Type 1 glutamine amidotransferase-like domain-containing protein, partial [Actinomycetes bacterium]